MSRSVAFFEALDSSGREGLWQSDGTASGTFEIGGPGSAGIAGALAEFDPGDIAAFGDGVLFQALDSSGGVGLWFSNGTAAGPREIGGANNAGITGAPVNSVGVGRLEPQDFSVFGSKEAFLGIDPASGARALWITDGTAAGTFELGGAGNAGIGLKTVGSILAVLGDQLLFSGSNTSGDYGLWVTDGTATGTQDLGGAGSPGIASANVFFPNGGVANLGDKDLLVANDSLNQQGLFVTDGTTAGTYEVFSSNDEISSLTPLGASALFVAYDAGFMPGLWVTNGTKAGTVEIGGLGDAGIANAYGNGLNPSNIVSLGDGKAVFVGYDAAGSRSLWVTDGTAAGTVEIGGPGNGDLAYVSAGAFNPQNLIRVGDKAIFEGYDVSGHAGLWVTDGTTAGTFEVGGVNNAGVAGTWPLGLAFFSNPVAAGSLAYFTAGDISGRQRLWVTDGTAAGTHILDSAGAYQSDPDYDNLADATGITAAAIDSASYTVAQIVAFSAGQFASLAASGVTHVVANGSLALPLAQALAFANAGLTLALPAKASASVLDKAAALDGLTASQIAALAKAGVTILDAKSGSPVFNAAQSAALQAAGFKLETPAGATASENEAGGGYLISSGPSGAFASSKSVNADGSSEIVSAVSGQSYSKTESIYELLSGKAKLAATAYENANGSGSLTLTAIGAAATEKLAAGGGALTLTVGADRWALPFHTAETLTLPSGSSSGGPVLSFTRGFGAETIKGFKLTGAGFDSLNFDPSLFASLSDLASDTHASGANLVIRDSFGDSLTLDGISRTSFLASPHIAFVA